MNSSRKRKRGSEVRSTFPFAQLPAELQKSVIEAAAEDDLPTAVNLTLTSQATYSMVVSTLYRKVFIGRPSALKELQATLASRPLLGRYVESLHFGPADSRRVDKFGHHWWPVNHDASEEDPRRPNQYVAHFSASLAGSCDANLIPEWCKDADLQWPLEVYHFPPDCRGRAISDALAAIQEAIDVDLGEEPLALSNTNLGSSLWIKRMFEAQAALDLYLAEMRRREESSKDYIGSWRAETPDQQGSTSAPTACNYGRCGHYPPLQLTGYPTTSQPTSQRQTHIEIPVVLSRSQLLAHMARPGARTDRFDHQLLFLTSGATITDLYSNGRAGGATDAEEAPELYNSDHESCASGAMILHNGIDVAVPSTASVASLLGLASSILSVTPNVRNLSLSGLFERLACGDRLPPQLPALRSLSIGPQPPHWRTPLRLSHPVLRQVKTLRLAGMMLDEEEVQALADLLNRGRLERVEYVMADHFSHRHSINIERIIESLLESKSSASSPGDEPGRHNEGVRETVEPSEEDMPKQLPLITVKLHLTDVLALLARAPNEATREAWVKGAPVPGQKRRLLVCASQAAHKGVARRDLGEVSGGWGVLYEEGREWWSRESAM